MNRLVRELVLSLALFLTACATEKVVGGNDASPPVQQNPTAPVPPAPVPPATDPPVPVPPAPPASGGTVFYIAPNGNDDNPGTEAQPWRTIYKAGGILKPGETVLIKDGKYTAGLNITRSGTPGKPITFKAFPGARPIFTSDTPGSGIYMAGSSYISIDGLELEDTAPGAERAGGERGESGILIQDAPGPVHSHHISVTNNRVHGFPGGGISTDLSDYITIAGNTVWENALWSKYDTSGISLYRNLNVDTKSGFHNVIRGNTVFKNENRLPFLNTGYITDGNCIIIDDSRNTQHDKGDPLKDVKYTGETLIENNICAGNGARGVHVYSSDNVLARHNTLYHNQVTVSINDGELSAFQSSNVRFVNNLVYAAAGKRANGTGNASNIVFERNLYFGTTDIPNKSSSDLTGDPLFNNASLDLGQADFGLQRGSPAIDAALAGQSPATDIGGRPRPLGVGSDIGAWESR